MKIMTPKNIALIVLIAIACAVQWALLTHVRAHEVEPTAGLQSPLASLPRQLGDWIGQDLPASEQLSFADDTVQRVYRHRTTGQQVTLWIAYSATAADRGHHPEVCMAVLGKPENRAKRAMLPVPGHEKPVQVLNFGQTGEQTWAFYWHYALSREAADASTSVQRLYRASRRLPPSVTLEVFANAGSPESLAGAAEFVNIVDQAIQPYLGSNPRRGNARLPVTIATGHQEPGENSQ